MLYLHSLAVILILTSCNKQSGEQASDPGASDTATEENEVTGDESTQAGEIQITTGTMQDLALSDALSFAVPAQVLAQGEGVQVDGSGKVAISTALTADEIKKSAAACRVRRRTKAGFRVLRGIARDLCYIENDAEKISIDKKYKIDFGNGDSKSVWIDHQDKTKLMVSFCSKDKLVYVFTVTGNKDGKSAGMFKSVDQFEESVVYNDGSYDSAYTEKDIVKVEMVTKTVDSTDQSAHVEGIKLRLDAERPSLVGATEWSNYKHESTGEFTTVFTSMYAIIGKNLATALLYLGGDQDGDGNPDAAPTGFRSYFDNAGRILPRSSSDLFSDGGKILTGVNNLRKPAGESFTESPFGDQAWDCSGAETITPSGTNEQYGVCDSLTAGFDDEDCSLPDFSDEGDEAISDLSAFGQEADPLQQ